MFEMAVTACMATTIHTWCYVAVQEKCKTMTLGIDNSHICSRFLPACLQPLEMSHHDRSTSARRTVRYLRLMSSNVDRCTAWHLGQGHSRSAFNGIRGTLIPISCYPASHHLLMSSCSCLQCGFPRPMAYSDVLPDRH